MSAKRTVPPAFEIKRAPAGIVEQVKPESEIRSFFGIFRKTDSPTKRGLKILFGIPIVALMLMYLCLEFFYLEIICNIPSAFYFVTSMIKKRLIELALFTKLLWNNFLWAILKLSSFTLLFLKQFYLHIKTIGREICKLIKNFL